MRRQIKTRHKIIECLQKTEWFNSLKIKAKGKGVETTILGDKIILSGRDTTSLNICSNTVNASLDKVKRKSTNITNHKAGLLTKNDVVVFIDNHLGMKDKIITWEVVVHDQSLLNVYYMDKEKKAANISGKIMACITEEKVSMEESQNEWFRNMLKNESSKLVTVKTKGDFIVICSTSDIHNKYFTEWHLKTKSPDNQMTATATGMSSVPCQNSIINSVGQPSTERVVAVESTDQPDLAATANQPSDNTLATTSSTTNFNGGNQPTNQLSQAQGGNGTSQNAEYAPGTQTDLNQPEPVISIPLSYWLLQYFEKFGWHKVDDICQESKVKYTVEGNRLLLNRNQKSVASVKKEIDSLLESLEILQEQTYCGKPLLPEDVRQKWIQTEKDKKCLIATERSEKPVLCNGWAIYTHDSKMHILYMEGSITLADVDVILCPVTGKLEPIDDATDTIRKGFDSTKAQNKAFQIQTARPRIKYKTGDLLPVYDTGNLKCQCLLLYVQDQLAKGVINHSAKLAKSIMSLLESSGYQSFGLSLDCDQNPVWEDFSFSLISYLWSYSFKLKYPVILYCFGGTEEIVDKLDGVLCENDKIEKDLDPFTLDRPNGREYGTTEIKITVEEGSILECSNKVDVIVNSVSTTLDLQRGFMSKELVNKAGNTIQKECKDQYKDGIDIGDIAVTSAGNLRNHKKIFHVALYTSWIFNGNLSMQILKTLMTRCLKEAEERKLSSIAFPALGTGYPPCLMAKTMFDAVEEYQKTNPKYLKTVHFVLFKDKEILDLFQNVKAWRKNKKRENGCEVDVPLKNVMYVEKHLETRVVISEGDFYSKLSYKELRVVFEEKHSQGLKIEWDINDGCYATDIQITYSEDGLRSCFRSVIHLMEENKLHIVDIFLPFKTSGMPLQTQFKIFIEELTTHDNKIKKENASAGKKKTYVINYVKVVRIFLSRDQFVGVVKEFKHWNTAHEGDKPVWHFTEKTAFPFRVTVVGKKTDTRNVLKKVLQDVSSIEVSVECERTQAQVATSRQVQQAKYKTEVHLGMVQQSAGRRNRKIASPDDYGSAGPSVSQSSVSNHTVKDGLCFTTKEGIRMYVYCAGIRHLEVDVVVNAANKDLQHDKGIAYQISRAAGYDFDKECNDYVRDHGPLDVGTCCLTKAGKLPYHSIIHAVGPMWHSYPDDQKQKCLDDLKMTILSTLLKTDRHHHKSIAIPSNSSGLFGVPKDLCAQQYQKAVTEFSHKFHSSTTIKEIHFVDIDKGMCSLIQKTFRSEFGTGIKM